MKVNILAEVIALLNGEEVMGLRFEFAAHAMHYAFDLPEALAGKVLCFDEAKQYLREYECPEFTIWTATRIIRGLYRDEHRIRLETIPILPQEKAPMCIHWAAHLGWSQCELTE